jgi:hypothetical protein
MPSSRVKQSTLVKMPEERRANLHCGGSLKSRIISSYFLIVLPCGPIKYGTVKGNQSS